MNSSFLVIDFLALSAGPSFNSISAMAVSQEFIGYVLDQFSRWGPVSVRRMFGGAGLYRNGKMFGLIASDVLYLKVDDSNRADFLNAGCSPFMPYPEKKMATVMSYYEVPAAVLEDSNRLTEWAERSLQIAQNNK